MNLLWYESKTFLHDNIRKTIGIVTQLKWNPSQQLEPSQIFKWNHPMFHIFQTRINSISKARDIHFKIKCSNDHWLENKSMRLLLTSKFVPCVFICYHMPHLVNLNNVKMWLFNRAGIWLYVQDENKIHRSYVSYPP